MKVLLGIALLLLLAIVLMNAWAWWTERVVLEAMSEHEKRDGTMPEGDR